MIADGDPVPDIEVRTPGPDGPTTVRTAELFASGRSVLFGVPGAFTPGCDRTHLPGFVAQADDLVAGRLTNPQIAERLFVRPATVKTHVSHIFAKVGVSMRSELAALAARQHDERPSP